MEPRDASVPDAPAPPPVPLAPPIARAASRARHARARRAAHPRAARPRRHADRAPARGAVPHRTAVFLTARTEGTPEVIAHHLRHNKVLHEAVVFLSVVPEEIPEVAESERITIEALGHGFTASSRATDSWRPPT